MSAVTNAMIIESYKFEHNITCPIHTYAKWQELGYQVKKGEKSMHKITIWKCGTKKVHDEESNDEESNTEITSSKLFMKTSAFFTINQVEKINTSERV